MKPNTKQAADHYGVTRLTICKWCRTGKLIAMRVSKDWIVDIAASDARFKKIAAGK
ncbi:MAG: hypothetical protein ACOYM3_05545 [Terrimicrobiaceae bacterium]